MKNIFLLKIPKIGIPFLLFVLLIFFNPLLLKAQVDTYTANGTWLCPAGVTSVTVECWGGGGAGGGTTNNNAMGGGGGAGGSYAKKVLAVIPGTNYTVTVGTGGAGATTAGPAGNPSWFNTAGTVYAEGGAGGAAPNGGASAGGVGSSASSIGDLVYKGGDGGNGSAAISGGGGGGAGSTGNGGNASGITAGTGTTLGGGNGATGSNGVGGNGLSGNIYGGGGSGAFVNDNTNRRGGSGASGAVVISYTCSSTTTATWTGTTSTDWNTATNWSTGAVPAVCTKVIIPNGCPRYPIISAAPIANCNDLQINLGATLTVNYILYINGSLSVSGSLISNGSYWTTLKAASSTLSCGASAVLTKVPLRIDVGASYTLTSDFGEPWAFWVLSGGSLTINTFKFKTQFFFNEGTTNLNSGTLELTDEYGAGAYITSPDGTSPYFGGTVNVGTSTVMYSPRSSMVGDQKVAHQLTYYNLTLNGRSAKNILISDDVPTHSSLTVTNDFKIINNTGADMGWGKIATNLNIRGNFRVGGNFQIGSPIASENYGIILELSRPIVKTTAGTGFTMYDNPNDVINILWQSPDSTAIYNFGNALTFYGTVNYDNSGSQKIIGSTYNNLTISSGGIRDLTSNITINKNLLINAGVLNATASNYNIDIKGDWTNKGSYDAKSASVFFNDKPTPTANVINGKAGTSGYVIQADFEGTAPGWSVIGYSGGTNWYLLGGLGYSGTMCVSVWQTAPLDVWVYLFSPIFNCSGQTSATLTFYNAQQTNEHQILFVTNNASAPTPTWVQIADYGTAAIAPWVKRTYNLASYVTLTSDMQLRWDGWHHTSGRYCAIDSLTVWTKPPSAMDNFYNLTMNRSLGVTVDNSLNISNNLTMTQGNISFNSPIDYLEIGYNTSNRGSLTYTNGIVVGKVKRWFTNATNSGNSSGMFPIGISSSFNSAVIEFTGAPTAGGSLTAQFITTLPADYFSGLPMTDGTQQIDNLANEGLWQIDAADGLTGGTYTSTLTGSNFGTFAIPNNVRVLKRPSTGGNWTLSGTHLIGSGPPLKVSRTGMSGFSQFALGGLYADGNPLPINLLNFTVQCNGNQAEIHWTTASESNNDFFSIERSFDSKTFTQISTIKAAGNSNTIKNYSFTDNQPSNGITYYRLKQTDYNGKFKYLAIKSTNCSSSISFEPSIYSYPNPFNNNVNFEISNIINNKFIIQITDVLGNLIETREIKDIENNNATIDIDMSKYPTGLYYYKLLSGSYIKTGKIIKN